MIRNLSLIIATRIFVLVANTIVQIIIVLAITIFAVFRGLWVQSDLVTNAWRNQPFFAGIDGHFHGPMYWTMRIVALLLMFMCLIVLSEGLSRLFEWALQL